MANTPSINLNHLSVLRSAKDGALSQANDNVWADLADEWRGRPVARWISAVFKDQPTPAALSDMPDVAMNRSQLYDFVAAEMDTGRRIAAILAWGGMFTINGRSMARRWATWVKTVDELKGQSRADDYEALRSEAARSKGIGPAYFTKLLFFLRTSPTASAYIMDQWTARSINLLFQPNKLLSLTRYRNGYAVRNSNTGEDYEEFCNRIEVLGRELGLPPQAVEILLFSKGLWRNYLRREAR